MRNIRLLPSRSQREHWFRWLGQKCTSPEVAIIGGYHHGNLGDMALGQAVKQILAESGVKGDLQTIYNLARWPTVQRAIVGGGAVGYGHSLEQLSVRYSRIPEHLAILGVDFNDHEAVHIHRKFLNSVPVITCRSEQQSKDLGALLNRSDITHHSDLAFALRPVGDGVCDTERFEGTRVGINVVPLYAKYSGGQFIPDLTFANERGMTEDDCHHLLASYRHFLRTVVKIGMDRDEQVIHVPFTPLDDLFAREALRGLNVRYLPYRSNPVTVLQEFRQFHTFFSTRFHSLIFALKSGVPVRPFCYASKCDRLLDSLAIDTKARVTPETVAESPESAARELFAPCNLLKPSTAEIEQISTDVRRMIERTLSCISSAGVRHQL